VINRSVARRYAQALMELVETDPQSVADRLVEFQQLLQKNPLLYDVLISPAFRLEERKKVFDKTIKRLGWGYPLDRFLWYLVEHRRMSWLGAIAESFIKMIDRREGRLRVRVNSAKPLDKAILSKLQNALKAGLEKKVVLEPNVDASLLAGLAVQVGDLVIDGSLRTHLSRLKDILVQRK